MASSAALDFARSTLARRPSLLDDPPSDGDCLDLYCPFFADLNPHVGEVQNASLAWALRYGLVSEAGVRHLAHSKIGWLVARAFSNASQQALQIVADWTHLFCLLDDRTDKIECPIRLSALLAGLYDAFESGVPTGPAIGDPFARGLLDLRGRMLAATSLGWVQGFASHLKQIFVGYLWETINCSLDTYPTLPTYLTMREITIGLYPQFHFAALTDGVILPPEVQSHPALRRLMSAASNCVGWANDLCTYEKELGDGEHHNLVIVLMRQKSLGVREAAVKAARMHDDEAATFLRVQERLPSFGFHDQSVQRFVSVLTSWIRGHLEWAQETGRYRSMQERCSHSSGTWARAALPE